MIQALARVSHVLSHGHRLHRECDAPAIFCMLAREIARREIDDAERELGLAHDLAVDR